MAAKQYPLPGASWRASSYLNENNPQKTYAVAASSFVNDSSPAPSPGGGSRVVVFVAT